MKNAELKELVYNTVKEMFGDEYEARVREVGHNGVAVTVIHHWNEKYTKESVVGYPTRVYAISGADNVVESLRKSFERFATKEDK